jgi:hypothetical protein
MQQLLFDSNYMEQAAKDYLIKLFTMYGEPCVMGYQYRKQHGRSSHRRDLPVLRQMMAEGTVKLIDVTATCKKYQYKEDGFDK